VLGALGGVSLAENSTPLAIGLSYQATTDMCFEASGKKKDAAAEGTTISGWCSEAAGHNLQLNSMPIQLRWLISQNSRIESTQKQLNLLIWSWGSMSRNMEMTVWSTIYPQQPASQLSALVEARFAHCFLDILFMLLEHPLHVSFCCNHWTWVLIYSAFALVPLIR